MATAEDVPAILEVLRAALGEPPGLERTEELWSWKHVSNPFGPSIVLLAEAQGRISGVRAFMRWELRTPRGEILRCVRAVDTATHPEFHRRGIFRTLTESAVEEAKADGVHLIFNTPNSRSGAGYLKMGWSEVGAIPVMVSPSLRILRKGAHDGGALIDAAPGSPSDVEDRSPRGLRTPRSDRYLRWRFGSHPTARYRWVRKGESTVVLRENSRGGRPELVVSELFGRGTALRSARRMSRADYLIGSFPPGSPERREALRAGMLPIPRMKAMFLVARPLADVGPITDISAWDLTLGDLELL